MSTHVHREGAHKITVRDETGREVTLISQDHALEISTVGAGPRLTPQMAHDLADELHQWATCQQTRRSQGHRPPASPRGESAPAAAADGAGSSQYRSS